MHDIYTLFESNPGLALLVLSHLFGDFITPSADAQAHTSVVVPIVRFRANVVGTFGSMGGQELLKRPP